MSYEYLIKQYANYIKSNIELVHCKVKELVDSLKAKEKEIRECNKPFIKVLKDDRLYFIYYGIPTGDQLWTFLNALVRISNNIVHLNEMEKKEAMGLNGIIKVYVNAECSRCSAALDTLYQVTLLNDKVKLEVIDVSFYEELMRGFNLEELPVIEVNEKIKVKGSGYSTALLLKSLRS